MAIKLDISKAYDRVEMEFLHIIMKKMGFSDKWVELILRYITSSSFSVFLNGLSNLLNSRVGAAIFFFADDGLILGSTDVLNCANIREVLSTYADASGQVINLQKYSITFSPNLSAEHKSQVYTALHMPQNESYEIYLGLPAFIGRNRNQVSDGIKQRVWRKLQAWKHNLFSAGDREILIKAVAQATSIYTMSIFKISYVLCHCLQQMIMKFWWSNNKN
ncbi:uncharacterized protein [Primulina eburnea]|uniref:uncharacterized protein n=1 Tax=Primulina eburnea TaxID=1245227 RepID=UPI003C6BED3A